MKTKKSAFYGKIQNDNDRRNFLYGLFFWILAFLTTFSIRGSMWLQKNLDTQMADKENQTDLTDRAYYISGNNRNTDIADILQNALNDSTISSVHVPYGDYTVSHKVVIPAGKQLILTGNNSSNFLTDAECSNVSFTKIKPTFDKGYCFQMSDRSTLKNGFINCSSMTSGGGIQLDFSQTTLSRITIDGTLLYGGNQWAVNAVFLNGDRPIGTYAGEAYFININIGAHGFGNGVYLKRHDTYTTVDSTTNSMAWITGVYIYGNMYGCQRYVYFDTSNNIFAGNSSIIKVRIQGAPVPNSSTPAVEVCGSDTILDCQFHDIRSTATNQTVKYKLNNTNDMIIIKGYKGSSDIQDSGLSTTYLQTGVAKQITSLATISNGWYVVTGGMCTLHMTITQLPVYTGWTTIYTLPFYSKYTSKKMCVTDDGVFVNVMTIGNNLKVINNNAVPKNITISISYPIL